MREKIKIAMIKQEISFLELAEATGIRYQTLTAFINGGKNTFFSNFEKICNILDLELCERN
jgi:DNA-binding Xre family transcriptional regulator